MALWLVFAGGCAKDEAADGGVLRLDRAQFVLSGQASPPGDDAAWRPVTLPDFWDRSRPGVSGVGWYRFRLSLKTLPDRLQAIWLQRIKRNAAVFVNGVLVGEDAPPGSRRVNSWNHPLYFTIPRDVLHVGDNVMLVRIHAEKYRRGRMSPVLFGADAVLGPLYERELFWRVTLSEIVGVFAFTMGLCVGLVWLYRRESRYAWFAAGSLAWAGYCAWYYVQRAPVPLDLWAAATNASGVWMIGLIWVFLANHTGFRSQAMMRAVLGWCIFSSVVLLTVPGDWMFRLLSVAYIALFPAYTVLFAAFLKSWRSCSASERWMTLAVLLLIMGLGLHDWLNFTFYLEHTYLMHYAAPLVFSLMGWSLLQRFIHLVEESEKRNVVLGQRVAEREQELDQAFRTIRRMERKKTREQERERIMRDIHDGVGGQLVSAMAIVESAEQPNPLLLESLSFALDDLRLIIDSLAPDEDNFEAMIAMFKYRIEPRLAQHGVQLDWRQPDSVALPRLVTQDSLQVMRMIQEVFSNVIKHAGASRISVEFAKNQDGRAQISICDNGRGFPADGFKHGRGLGNMRRRVSEMDADVRFYNSNQGACVSMILPASAVE